MKKVLGAVGRSGDVIAIASMIAIVLSVLIQFALRPVGSIFHITFYIALIVLAIVMITKVIANFKEITKERTQFLVVNIVSFVVLVAMILGLHFNYFENETPAVILNYVALALYIFTSLTLL
jgi:hypothetical protein